MPSLAGQELDKYAVLEEVGHGGMAVVYRGMDQVLDREVAVKVLHPHLADREESRQRLRREALTVAKLRHENIVEIYDYSGPDAAESYIVTEFIHGQTLRDWLDRHWVPHPVVAALVMYRLCLALEHAHAIGVVHRDIKPENVMIRRDGCLKLMDFGIAQILDQQKLTMTGQLLGSPAYMAPELICGKPVDKRTDLFACGVLLYQLATGQLPFSGRNPHEVLHKISDAQYQPASHTNPKVDDTLSELIDHALAQEPGDRFQSARAMANELEDYLGRFDLEPDDIDLRAYFKEPRVFLDEFDARLSETLLHKARAETKAGHRAKALGLLAQVLEIDPDNKDAHSLVDEVKASGRRLRIVAFMAAALAVGGLVVAAVTISRATQPAVASIDAGGDTTMARRNNDPVIPADRRPNRTPGATGAPLEPATGATAGTGSAGATGGDRPRPVGPKIRTTGPVSHNVTCRVKVQGLTAVELANRYYRVKAGGQSYEIDPKTGEATFEVPSREPIRTYLEGPARKGDVRIDPSGCKSGSTTMVAQARPATVRFRVDENSPFKPPLGDISLECSSNCWRGGGGKTAAMAVTFDPPSPDQTSWEVVIVANVEGAKRDLKIERRVNSSDRPQTIDLVLPSI